MMQNIWNTDHLNTTQILSNKMHNNASYFQQGAKTKKKLKI